MDAYERLNRVRAGKTAYERLLSKVEYLTALSERVTPILSGMPKASAKPGQTDDTWAILADYKRECEEQLRMYVTACRELEQELSCIKSVRVRTAMYYRYVDLYPIPSIAEAMSMNERNVYKLLKRGRILYERYYREEYDAE